MSLVNTVPKENDFLEFIVSFSRFFQNIKRLKEMLCFRSYVRYIYYWIKLKPKNVPFYISYVKNASREVNNAYKMSYEIYLNYVQFFFSQYENSSHFSVFSIKSCILSKGKLKHTV